MAGIFLDFPDLFDHSVERRRHRRMHETRIIPTDIMRRPSVPTQQLIQLFMADARKQCRVGDFIAVEMQDGQHRPIRRWMNEFIRMPSGGQRPGFGFTITDHAGDDELWIIKYRTERMAQRVSQLAAFVDRARAFRRRMTGNSTWK